MHYNTLTWQAISWLAALEKDLGFWLTSLFFAVLVINMLVFYRLSLRNRLTDLLFREAQSQQKLALQQAVLEGQEAERQQLAGILHDHISALFATTKLYLGMFRNRAGQFSPEQENAFQLALSVIDQTALEVKNLSKQLSSAVLERLGLVEAAEDLCQLHLEPANIDYRVWPFGFDERLHLHLEQSLYRMLTELLQNIRMHAEATKVDVRFHLQPESLQLAVEDNGKGFDPKLLTPTSISGLSSIAAQIAFLNGQIQIDSQPNMGTVIILEVPTQPRI